MTPIRITAATDDEREWAARLMAASEPWLTLGRGLDQCRSVFHLPGYLTFVGREGDRLCAFLLAQRRGVAGSPYIASIAVAPEFRGAGVGSQMMAFIEGIFRNDGARHIFLCVSSFNPRARALYLRLGYAQVGEFKDYVVPGESEILMHKRLTP